MLQSDKSILNWIKFIHIFNVVYSFGSFLFIGVIADGQGNKLALTDENIAAAEPFIKKQITLGGRRLAELIKQIYPNDSTTSFLQ